MGLFFCMRRYRSNFAGSFSRGRAFNSSGVYFGRCRCPHKPGISLGLQIKCRLRHFYLAPLSAIKNAPVWGFFCMRRYRSNFAGSFSRGRAFNSSGVYFGRCRCPHKPGISLGLQIKCRLRHFYLAPLSAIKNAPVWGFFCMRRYRSNFAGSFSRGRAFNSSGVYFGRCRCPHKPGISTLQGANSRNRCGNERPRFERGPFFKPRIRF